MRALEGRRAHSAELRPRFNLNQDSESRLQMTKCAARLRCKDCEGHVTSMVRARVCVCAWPVVALLAVCRRHAGAGFDRAWRCAPAALGAVGMRGPVGVRALVLAPGAAPGSWYCSLDVFT